MTTSHSLSSSPGFSASASVKEARIRLAQMVLTDTPFNEQFAPAQLHWILADKNECIVIEPMADGLHIYDNPVGVLTNNPPFPQQLFSLNNYMNLSPKQPQNTFSADLPLTTYSRCMGALGLPGDLSSASRFARVAFTKSNARSGASELESVSQFFHILGSRASRSADAAEVISMENMKSHSTPPAAMRIRGFTTTRRMKTIRSRQWI